MISLRRHIDSYQQTLSDASLDAFRSMLLAIGECGKKAVPIAGDLDENLNRIQQGLSTTTTTESLSAVNAEVRSELSQWAERAEQHHLDNEREIREIIAVVARAAESVSERDERYAKEIGDLTGRLRGSADLHDVSTIRRSIIESTKALKECVQKMAEDSKASVHQLTTEVTEYRRRLEESERLSATEPLTGLANRRAFERQLEARIMTAKAFCLVLLDLNDFKRVNDSHGHVAGDDLLKKFAVELKGQFTPADLVARWGGDEFAVLVADALPEAEVRVERIKRWALGEYKIAVGAQVVKTQVNASIGVVEWRPGESGVNLLARADKAVYRAKELKHAGAAKQAVR